MSRAKRQAVHHPNYVNVPSTKTWLHGHGNHNTRGTIHPLFMNICCGICMILIHKKYFYGGFVMTPKCPNCKLWLQFQHLIIEHLSTPINPVKTRLRYPVFASHLSNRYHTRYVFFYQMQYINFVWYVAWGSEFVNRMCRWLTEELLVWINEYYYGQW